VRDQRRQPHLQALDVLAVSSNLTGREAGDEAASLLPTVGVIDEYPVAEVDEHRHRRIRDHLEVDDVLRPIAESSHGDPGQPKRP
jgi:hypothetical protein